MKLILLLAFISAFNICFAQLLTSNNVSLTITNGITLTVNGEVTSTGTTTINNNGIITATGDFINNTNNNLFGLSAGTVILNGAVQNINGNFLTVFNNLVLTGTGNKTLFNEIVTGGMYVSPSGVLSLNDKVLFLNSNRLTITNNNPGAITRSTGFIQSETDPITGYGKIKWMIGNSIAGSVYIFPFGIIQGPEFIPLQVEITGQGNGLTGNLTISTYSTSSNNLPLPTGVTSLINFNGNANSDKVIDRFWIIEPADYVSLPVSDIVFTYRDIEHTQPTNNINEVNLQMQYNNGNIWSPILVGLINTTANTILVNNVSDYAFAWTAVDNSSPLPIELLSFTAQPFDKEMVLAKWTTATEINNDFFTLQRSVNGFEFNDIGIVKGAGNSNLILNYKFYDLDPLQGISYYKLRQTDFDGTYTYSEIVAVSFEPKLTGYFRIFPNPTQDYIYLSTTKDDVGHVKIFDVKGRIVKEIFLNGQEGRIDIEDLNAGFYFIELLTEKLKFVKQ
jgi:hypothetical protein